ncbi:hypothetical protein FH972_023092 [Carpinus fangiana]|uniref:Proteasome alpha-type subunits domain-containing protein n=1 Tax=Carpinus fangiana TaxID=176857 RepID=A0A5N6KU60_9ROSI|nr:hypothetical protein FH972_023092 [Carpinus fangiana]
MPSSSIAHLSASSSVPLHLLELSTPNGFTRASRISPCRADTIPGYASYGTPHWHPTDPFQTTIFSPEGRLYQVEYALEAISHAGTALGILAKDGIVLAAERKVTSKLLEQDTSAEKLYILNDNMICAVAGMTADANILINYARQAAQRYLLTYNEEIPCEQLVRRLCDLKQGYTQHGGLRPFGVSFVYAGWDEQRRFQLYQSNPSGNYGGWKATSIGNNSQSAQSILKQDYKEDMTLEEAEGLAVKVLSKTMDSSKLSSEKVRRLLSCHYPLLIVHQRLNLRLSANLLQARSFRECGVGRRSMHYWRNTALRSQQPPRKPQNHEGRKVDTLLKSTVLYIEQESSAAKELQNDPSHSYHSTDRRVPTRCETMQVS